MPQWTTGPDELTTPGFRTSEPDETDEDNVCTRDMGYKEEVAKFCKDLLFIMSLENVLCSQVTLSVWYQG